MTIQSSPLVTVKQAAAALGVPKQAIEQRLENGRLQGKKEKILSKDVWLIYKSEVDALLEKRQRTLFDDEYDQTDFDPESVAVGAADISSDLAKQLAALQLVVEEEPREQPLTEQFQMTLRLMSEEFSRCMQASLEHIHELRLQLHESESKLLLLSDMEKRAVDDRQSIEDKDAALTAAHERIATLQADVERLSRPWWKRLLG